MLQCRFVPALFILLLFWLSANTRGRRMRLIIITMHGQQIISVYVDAEYNKLVD